MGLTTGNTYKFKVFARNSVYTSLLPSNEVTIVCASIPAAPAGVVSSNLASMNIKITWQEPASGLTITAYRIKIRQSNNEFSEATNCDGSDPAIVNALACTIETLVLMSAPFSLSQGE
jgi:hypothetical protein